MPKRLHPRARRSAPSVRHDITMLIKVFAILIVLYLFPAFVDYLNHEGLADTEEERCQPYARTENFLHCYDLKTIQYSSERFVKVMIKTTAVTDKGKEIKIRTMEKRGLSTEGYENYLYTYELVEIDCEKNKIRTWLFSDHDHTGKSLNIVIQPKEIMEKWFIIPSQTTADLLHRAVCPQKGKKSK
jgi:hypothetical protein